jgi:hypothetical protein
MKTLILSSPKFSLRIANIIVTKITAAHPTVAVITNGLAVTIEPLINQKHIIIFAKKKTTDHRNIRIRNKQERKRLTKASSITTQKDTSIIALRNGSSNILLSTRKKITKIQR